MTRDRKELVCEWNGKRFLLVDTGGVDIADPSPITRSDRRAGARRRSSEADLVLFVVDAKAGITPGDEELAEILRRCAQAGARCSRTRSTTPRRDDAALEFHRARARRPDPALGAARPRHRRPARRDRRRASRDAARSRSATRRSASPSSAARTSASRSLLNALLGEERRSSRRSRARRATRSTRVLERGEPTFVLVDTAGLRRKRRQRQGIEYYSELRALEAAERADVALVLVDATRGPRRAGPGRRGRGAQGAVLDARRALQVGRDGDRLEDVRPRARCAGCASGRRSSPCRRTTGRGVDRLLDNVEQLFDKHTSADPDARAEPVARRAARGAPAAGPRTASGSTCSTATQVQTRPPRFRLFVNDPGLITRDYGYWVENQLRERFALEGVPVVDRLRATLVNVRRRRRLRVVGHGVRRAARATAATRSTLACRDPSRRPRSPRPAATRATSRASTSRASTAAASRTRRSTAPTSSCSPCPSRAFGEVVAACRGERAGARA